MSRSNSRWSRRMWSQVNSYFWSSILTLLFICNYTDKVFCLMRTPCTPSFWVFSQKSNSTWNFYIRVKFLLRLPLWIFPKNLLFILLWAILFFPQKLEISLHTVYHFGWNGETIWKLCFSHDLSLIECQFCAFLDL